MHGQELKVVQSAKLSGVTVTSNLSWNEHINDIVNKASKTVVFSCAVKKGKAYLQRSSSFLYHMH